MRSILWLLLVARVATGQDVAAPGLGDALPDRPWDPARAWTTSVASGVAFPWGDLPVRTDWVRGAWAARPLATSVVVARTQAAHTERSVVDAGVALRLRRLGVRAHVRRVETTVAGFDAERRTAVAWSGRFRLPRGALGYAVAREPASPRWRSRWSWVDGHRSLRWIVARTDARFDRTPVWDVGVFLALTRALEIGVAAGSLDTLWAFAVRKRGWTLRVGAVVDGPRQGATALAVEWMP